MGSLVLGPRALELRKQGRRRALLLKAFEFYVFQLLDPAFKVEVEALGLRPDGVRTLGA